MEGMLLLQGKGPGAMRIETLKEFLAVVQYGSFTGAAKALYVSQPSLSKHIASLESEVGCKLFFNERPLILTEAGRIVMEYASSVVSKTENMELRLAPFKNQTPSLIRIQDISFFRHLANRALDVKEAVMKVSPGITFQTVVPKTHQTSLEALLGGTVDIAFLFNITTDPTEPVRRDEGLYEAIPLYGSTGELYLGVPAASHLLERGDLRLKDFANQSFFTAATRNYDGFIQDFRSLCLAEGFLPQVEFVTTGNSNDFWSQDRGDSVMFMSVSPKHRDFAQGDDASLLQRYVPVCPFAADDPHYIAITLIARREKHGEALQAFLDTVSGIEAARREEMLADPAWKPKTRRDGGRCVGGVSLFFEGPSANRAVSPA